MKQKFLKSNVIDIHISNNQAPLFVAFGGICGQLHMPPFEFRNFLIKHFGDVNFIFIRDLKQAWYFRGLNGLSNNVKENIQILSDLLCGIDKTQTIFIGNSMGGFASILYGTKLNIDTVLSFAPQTFIDRKNREKHQDKRWQQQINTIYKIVGNNKYYNLLNLEWSTTKIKIFYGMGSKLDVIHTKRFKSIPNTTIVGIANVSHGVIRTLRDNGQLFKIIKDTIGV